MTLKRAIRLAQKWAFGGVCTLREGEAQEYHKMALAALRAQQERGWISVKDRRPEYKTRVLFVDVRGLVFLAIDSVDWDDGHVSFLEPASGLWVQGSHWMPLPEPPKEEV